MTYAAPVRDIRFSLEEIAGLADLRKQGLFTEASADLIEQILVEAGKLAGDVLAPLNAAGDRAGTQLTPDGSVVSPDGFAEAYRQFVDGAWLSIPFDPAIGGMGLPKGVALAVHEMIHAANMSFGLCPMLTLGAVEALSAHGTDAQKALYLPKLVTGQWSGTMNLTEPQAGSDVGALTSRAEPQPDGTYKIFGQKIYITWGEHEMAENIVHLVLARLPDAPAGVKGISLFLVPKFIPDAEGKPGHHNDVRCIGLEHKMGIHASPTCTMSYGDQGGAIGWIIGEPNKGLSYMFTMMNSARLNVGLQGVAVGDAAFQKAYAYAGERKQGRAEGWTEAGPSPIFHHADVRRMLMTMKAKVSAARSICHMTALAADVAEQGHTADDRRKAKAREELLTPIAKGWSTDMGVEIASLGVQIHGGMGFVEEGGAAQFYRDARIAAIYEGTNGIQAIDLVSRKLTMDDGAPVEALIADMRATASACEQSGNEQVKWIGKRLSEAVDVFADAAHWLIRAQAGNAKRDALAGATPFLKLAGDVTGGWTLAKGALAALGHLKSKSADTAYMTARISLAGFFAENVLAQVPGLLASVTAGSDVLFEPEMDALAG
ncbi:3-methylmercaptopropionyl-CoA dehydrogenase [Candidatus Phycosocius bacilliformis]|uniref:3-methylmercaptopropionyl-CoA dehydrogenase n=1 Tax=Candidatus Phycosocius bacilliformis TaxID=1445552 RepID=A0A2P2EEE4_9PROT|nr:acyl-CoA dehydrogenase [Candidatus Phycosocius bacilliformis]GBF59429.1 3-methylmercaptopropionyl-CoA dehydrogenase [Candidatus Phycosocius bacilliformis]